MATAYVMVGHTDGSGRKGKARVANYVSVPKTVTGSGTTGVAALAEGFRFTGAELSDEYATIARARLSHAQQIPPAGF